MNKDQITLKQLMRMADDISWERFEAMTDGRLLLKDCAQTMLAEEEEVNPLLWLFEMRVGLHFERPMQAIMSCGHFIRMRSAERWQKFSLNKLDPCHPSGCLYWYSSPSESAYSWQPMQDLNYFQAMQRQNFNIQAMQLPPQPLQPQIPQQQFPQLPPGYTSGGYTNSVASGLSSGGSYQKPTLFGSII